MFHGNFVKSESFLAVLRKHVISNVRWVEVRKMSEILWEKLYYKMTDLFLLCVFLLEDDVHEDDDDVHWHEWMNIKKLYARNNIFKKKIKKIQRWDFWIIYILVQISFLGDCFRVLLASIFFHFLSSANNGCQHFYSAPSWHHEKVSCGPVMEP